MLMGSHSDLVEAPAASDLGLGRPKGSRGAGIRFWVQMLIGSHSEQVEALAASDLGLGRRKGSR